MTHSDVKGGARILAIACGPLKARKALMVGVVGRSGGIVECILSSEITVDGTDSTSGIIGMLGKSRFRDQVRLLALNGIAMAGLNVVDAGALGEALGTKVLLITKRKPARPRLLNALKAFSGRTGAHVEGRLGLVKKPGARIELREGVYVQSYGDIGDGAIRASYGLLRLAHMIASGISIGESRGRL